MAAVGSQLHGDSGVMSLSLLCCSCGHHPTAAPCLRPPLSAGFLCTSHNPAASYLCSRSFVTCPLPGGLPPPIPSPAQLPGKGSLARPLSEHGFRPGPPQRSAAPRMVASSRPASQVLGQRALEQAPLTGYSLYCCWRRVCM